MLMSATSSFDLRLLTSGLSAILDKHVDVPGVSIGLLYDYREYAVNCGYARTSTQERMTASHFMECASLSKTVAAAFMCEYFKRKNISLQSSVNSVLESIGSKWKIEIDRSLPEMVAHPEWVDEVTLAMLVSHTALGMHYVYGVPLSDEFPSAQDLLEGKYEEKYGYAPLLLAKRPGSKFAYSGGGFIVLQHLLETMEGKSIEEITRPFLNSVGLTDFSFNHVLDDTTPVAYGHIERGREVQPHDGGRLAFPPLAAGGLCTSLALITFLNQLCKAYDSDQPEAFLRDIHDEWSISKDTARFMLGEDHLVDLGAMSFMRALVGHGVFVANAGSNKIMLHQAANEGFRGVYMVCFEGPDKGKGFALLCNGDNPAVQFQSEACRHLLSSLEIGGIDFTKINQFDMSGLKQEEIVNIGLKELVLAGFQSAGERCGKDGDSLLSRL